MYLQNLMTVITEALQASMRHHPVPEFRDAHVSMEYPFEQVNYPGIWIGWNTTLPLQNAGVGHIEWYKDASGRFGEVRRWYFQGTMGFTIMAMTSLERARFHDELIRIIAFSQDNPQRTFRDYILGSGQIDGKTNDLLAVTPNFDTIDTRNMAETPGTPWDTSEIVYEVTVSLDAVGEFVSDPTGRLVPLSKIVLKDYPLGTPDPYPLV